MNVRTSWDPTTVKYYRPVSRIALIGTTGKKIVTSDEANQLAKHLKNNCSAQISAALEAALTESVRSQFQTGLPEEALPVIMGNHKPHLDAIPFPNKPWEEIPSVRWPCYEAYFYKAEDLWWKIIVTFSIIPCHSSFGAKLLTSVCLQETCQYQSRTFKSIGISELEEFLKRIQIIAQEINSRVWPIYKKAALHSIDRKTRHVCRVLQAAADTIRKEKQSKIYGKTSSWNAISGLR